MNLDEFQKQTMKHLVNKKYHSLEYYALGLGGEAGEVLDKIKKMVRDDGGVLTDERKQALINELGDVCWYISQMANAMDVKFSDFLKANIEKAERREKNNTKHGDGDER